MRSCGANERRESSACVPSREQFEVSASLLSQVETGKTQPSVSTLYALVNHLGDLLDALMGAKPGVPVHHSATPLGEVG